MSGAVRKPAAWEQRQADDKVLCVVEWSEPAQHLVSHSTTSLAEPGLWPGGPQSSKGAGFAKKAPVTMTAAI